MEQQDEAATLTFLSGTCWAFMLYLAASLFDSGWPALQLSFSARKLVKKLSMKGRQPLFGLTLAEAC